jgi:hypothetical protein
MSFKYSFSLSNGPAMTGIPATLALATPILANLRKSRRGSVLEQHPACLQLLDD